MDTVLLDSLEWRCIGPHRGGRVVAVSGHPTDQNTFYFGACAGGIWKTDDAGMYWRCISDGYLNTASVGAIAVSETFPNIIYVGTGESCVRGNVCAGDGVYKSTDGGNSWRHIGLKDTKHISRIRIHPLNPEIVYVAALGDIFQNSEERGVYRTLDGGNTWEKVLCNSDRAGAADLSLDINNPDILFASLWDARRSPWNFSSGGPESGIFYSNNGGDTWENINDRQGLPQSTLGRVGLSISPAKAGRVWAVIECAPSIDNIGRGLYRSDDGGITWSIVSDKGDLVQRPWYYSHVFAHPTNPEELWILNLKAWKSNDGGLNWTEISTPHGDNHDIWIDPKNTDRMIEGNDGGACVSLNGGDTWSSIDNQPTAQFYRMTSDNQFPYKVYATQQDNSAISTPSRSVDKGAITFAESQFVGSSESGQIAVHPDNPNIIFSGGIGSYRGGGGILLRHDLTTGQTRSITVWPENTRGWGLKHHKHRFQWTYPISFSPHDSNCLYTAGEVVFRSLDEGQSWTIISPDLTRNDSSKMEASGGPLTKDASYVEHFGTIVAFAESPIERGLLWAASDDGIVSMSDDNGLKWNDITPTGLPEWATINAVELSAHSPNIAYISAHRYRLGDNSPYLYRTVDYGRTWTKIVTGISEDEHTWVIKSDTEKPGLLYAGAERGIYISFDDGESWQSIRGESAQGLNPLPVVPVHDIVVNDNELAIATHGRSFWILDELSFIRQVHDDIKETQCHLFRPPVTYRVAPRYSVGATTGQGKGYMLELGHRATWEDVKIQGGQSARHFLDAGKNPSDGVVVTYYLKARPKNKVAITFIDENGQDIKTFRSKPSNTLDSSDEEQFITCDPGINKFVWDMRYPDSTKVEGHGRNSTAIQGPVAPPGVYTVRLDMGRDSKKQSFELVKDPRVTATSEDFDKQFALLIGAVDLLSSVHNSISRIRNIRCQLDEWVKKCDKKTDRKTISDKADKIVSKLWDVEDHLISREGVEGQDILHYPAKLVDEIKEIVPVVDSSDFAPTSQAIEVLDGLSSRERIQADRLNEIITVDVAEFVNVLEKLDIPRIVSDHMSQ